MMYRPKPSRGRALHGPQVRVGHVLQVGAAVQELVGLDVRVGVGVAHAGDVVRLREETRGPQDDHRQPVLRWTISARFSAAALVTP